MRNRIALAIITDASIPDAGVKPFRAIALIAG